MNSSKEIHDKKPHFTIIGAGAAGLAVGYYARKNRFPFTIYEASERIGGNAITLSHHDFLFDSGAHRFHDRNRESTSDIVGLMEEELVGIHVPSQIYFDGKFIDFPLSPLSLMKGLGPLKFVRAGIEVLRGKLKKTKPYDSFASFAVQTYGKTIAERFLLNYSQKLWGRPCEKLSLSIAGKRLEGLTLKTFIIEALLGGRAKTTHLDGSFYYPPRGIGRIADKMRDYCGEENIVLGSKITKLFHDEKKVISVELNHDVEIPVEQLICTVPLNHLLNMMTPPPPQELLDLVKDLEFRCVILAVFLLNKESVSKNASIYFPEQDIPFTRIYEPKMRGANMAPEGRTSIVAEIPCQMEDNIWRENDTSILERVRDHLVEASLISEDEIIDVLVHRMHYAYPILETGYENKLFTIHDYLRKFSNLKVSGRNGKFAYIHIHDMMEIGREVIGEFLES
jgi:protoporphyrinogen oxidase